MCKYPSELSLWYKRIIGLLGDVTSIKSQYLVYQLIKQVYAYCEACCSNDLESLKGVKADSNDWSNFCDNLQYACSILDDCMTVSLEDLHKVLISVLDNENFTDMLRIFFKEDYDKFKVFINERHRYVRGCLRMDTPLREQVFDVMRKYDISEFSTEGVCLDKTNMGGMINILEDKTTSDIICKIEDELLEILTTIEDSCDYNITYVMSSDRYYSNEEIYVRGVDY